jgi:hypothetical protein
MDPSNSSYYAKLQIALERLSLMASQRGLRSIADRIREMRIDTASHTEFSQATPSPA